MGEGAPPNDDDTCDSGMSSGGLSPAVVKALSAESTQAVVCGAISCHDSPAFVVRHPEYGRRVLCEEHTKDLLSRSVEEPPEKARPAWQAGTWRWAGAEGREPRAESRAPGRCPHLLSGGGAVAGDVQQCAPLGAPRLVTRVSEGDMFYMRCESEISVGSVGWRIVCGTPFQQVPRRGCPGCARRWVSSVRRLACQPWVAVAVAGACYILHLRESTPSKAESGWYRLLAGGSL